VSGIEVEGVGAGYEREEATSGLPLNKHSIAYASSIVVKKGPGVLYGFTVYSSNSSAQFIQVFDLEAVPADGAIPAFVATVGATSNLGSNWIPGRAFQVGCVICNSSTGPTKTIGSADSWFDVQFL
jgi:hypothetical protein